VASRVGSAAYCSRRPGVFTLNPAGLVAASLVRSKADLPQIWEPLFQVDASGSISARPIVFGEDGEDLSLVLYCTGVRGRSSTAMVSVQIADLTLPVSCRDARCVVVQYVPTGTSNLDQEI